MEEVQQENQKPEEKRGSVAMGLAAIFLAVYFLCPPLLMYPVLRTYPTAASAPRYVINAFRIVFYPIEKLTLAFPAYERLILWEADLLGVNM